MKLAALSAVALSLAFAPPAAADDPNAELVTMFVISFAVDLHCKYDIVEGGGMKFADSIGANYDTYWPATMNAMLAIVGSEYDRTKLIPDVTQRVRRNMTEVDGIIGKQGKASFCRLYGDVMKNANWMRPKKGS